MKMKRFEISDAAALNLVSIVALAIVLTFLFSIFRASRLEQGHGISDVMQIGEIK
jgi:hypothetical protein